MIITNNLCVVKGCEGCFCNDVTCRAKGDRIVGLDFEERELKSQTQNSTENPNSDPRANGTSSKNI